MPANFKIERAEHIVLWWLAPSTARAVVPRTWEQTRAAFDRAIEVLPGATVRDGAIETSMVCLTDPGQPLVVHSRLVDDVIGLIRPFAVGNLAGPELTFTAAVENHTLRLPLLGDSPRAIRAATLALNDRAGRDLPWHAFALERHAGASSDFDREMKARRSAVRANRPTRRPK